MVAGRRPIRAAAERDRRIGPEKWEETQVSLNRSRDARIAEVAIKQDLVLVTDDTNLMHVVITHGGQSMPVASFAKGISDE